MQRLAGEEVHRYSSRKVKPFLKEINGARVKMRDNEEEEGVYPGWPGQGTKPC